MRLSSNYYSATECLAALAAGVGLGLTLGVFFAPKSGRELRADVSKGTSDTVSHFKQQADQVKASAAGLVDKGARAFQDNKQKLAQAAEAGKRSFEAAAVS